MYVFHLAPCSFIKIILLVLPLLLLIPRFTLLNVHPHVIMAKQRPVLRSPNLVRVEYARFECSKELQIWSVRRLDRLMITHHVAVNPPGT